MAVGNFQQFDFGCVGGGFLWGGGKDFLTPPPMLFVENHKNFALPWKRSPGPASEQDF